jgi:hypothetical protein
VFAAKDGLNLILLDNLFSLVPVALQSAKSSLAQLQNACAAASDEHARTKTQLFSLQQQVGYCTRKAPTGTNHHCASPVPDLYLALLAAPC